MIFFAYKTSVVVTNMFFSKCKTTMLLKNSLVSSSFTKLSIIVIFHRNKQEKYALLYRHFCPFCPCLHCRAKTKSSKTSQAPMTIGKENYYFPEIKVSYPAPISAIGLLTSRTFQIYFDIFSCCFSLLLNI